MAAIHVCGTRIWHDTELEPRPHLFLLSMVLPAQRAMLLLSFLFVLPSWAGNFGAVPTFMQQTLQTQ